MPEIMAPGSLLAYMVPDPFYIHNYSFLNIFFINILLFFIAESTIFGK